VAVAAVAALGVAVLVALEASEPMAVVRGGMSAAAATATVAVMTAATDRYSSSIPRGEIRRNVQPRSSSL